MAGAVVTIPFEKYGAYMQALKGKSSEALSKGVLSAAMRAETIVVDEAQKKRVFNTGYYVRAWKAERRSDRTSIRVYNLAPYAGVIEEGRRPQPGRTAPRPGTPRRPRGSGPIPMEQLPAFRKAIAAWVMRKFGLPYEQAYPVMWAVSNSINKRGIPARRVLGDATPTIATAFAQEVERELKRALGIP